ncbi:MAG TPA: SDR family NAD(P)-dependent oxidoreductase [Alphaproteobacteria bacterium]|jgi:3alpha(or 20beta)-hydroxysteroid dehydrogenase|nr:SDR family NAD(P)-dependent oxidoreductase [Alphaproteobacteria bacterium]
MSRGRLEGKVAIVTGAARGVGAETARLLYGEGASVVVADVLEDAAAALVGELGPGAVACRADVSSAADWQRLVAAAHDFGPVSILVNNAAVLAVSKLEDAEVAEFERLFRVNQLGPFLGIKAVMQDMIAARAGSIINIGSVDGLTAQDIGLTAYGATKWALRGLTKMAALELGRYGIRVNCVHPDGGNPEMSAPFLPAGMAPAQAMEMHVHQILEPAQGQPRNNRMRDVANMVVFLASDEGAGCTAGDFMVDGGYSAGRRFITGSGDWG